MRHWIVAAGLAVGLGTTAAEAATVSQDVTVTFLAEGAPCFELDSQTELTCRAEMSFTYPFAGEPYEDIFASSLFLFDEATGSQIGDLPVLWVVDDTWDPESGEPPFCTEACTGYAVGADGRLTDLSWVTVGGNEGSSGDLRGFNAFWTDRIADVSYLAEGNWTSITYEGLPAPVPLPASVVMLGAALAALGAFARRGRYRAR